jgi:hypothetical protein
MPDTFKRLIFEKFLIKECASIQKSQSYRNRIKITESLLIRYLTKNGIKKNIPRHCLFNASYVLFTLLNAHFLSKIWDQNYYKI